MAFRCQRPCYNSAVMPKPNKPKPKPGPKPETLKIKGDWQAAVKTALQKKKPATGWPKAPKGK